MTLGCTDCCLPSFFLQLHPYCQLLKALHSLFVVLVGASGSLTEGGENHR